MKHVSCILELLMKNLRMVVTRMKSLINFLNPFCKDIKKIYKKKWGSDFVFDGVNFLYYYFNKISTSRGGSYIDSPKWLKDKK